MMDSGWDLGSSIFPADALKSLAVCTKTQYQSLFKACSDTFVCLLSLSILSSHLFPKAVKTSPRLMLAHSEALAEPAVHVRV